MTDRKEDSTGKTVLTGPHPPPTSLSPVSLLAGGVQISLCYRGFVGNTLLLENLLTSVIRHDRLFAMFGRKSSKSLSRSSDRLQPLSRTASQNCSEFFRVGTLNGRVPRGFALCSCVAPFHLSPPLLLLVLDAISYPLNLGNYTAQP